MSTHNICFCDEIRNISELGLKNALSGTMMIIYIHTRLWTNFYPDGSLCENRENKMFMKILLFIFVVWYR